MYDEEASVIDSQTYRGTSQSPPRRPAPSPPASTTKVPTGSQQPGLSPAAPQLERRSPRQHEAAAAAPPAVTDDVVISSLLARRMALATTSAIG